MNEKEQIILSLLKKILGNSRLEHKEGQEEFEFNCKSDYCKHDKNKQCAQCNEKISDTQIRTIIMKNKNPEVIYFCCLKCMEKYNFPKFKK
jgi:uncharacterized beta-barrel protein YwiB (DUF1934 family)